MIKSMTGFGSVQITVNKAKFIIEIKSINHRYCDIVNYLPTGFGTYEENIRGLVKKEIARGRVTLSVKIVDKEKQAAALNKRVIRQYLASAKKISKEFSIENDLRISDILTLPGVFESQEIWIEPKDVWPGLEKGIKRAIKALVMMRKKEGKSLVVDIGTQLKRMNAQIKKIQARTKVLLRNKKKSSSDDEFCSFQKSSDINEEISRLAHHVAQTKALLRGASSSGKKIDFIAQEMQRETNTIGSKVQDSVVTNAVIALKSKVEKIREQAQNIE